MNEEIENLKRENEHLVNRIKMLEAPFDFENPTVIDIEIDNIVEDVFSSRIARINNCEFVNGGLYMALVSKHFKDIEESLYTKMVANRMAECIEEAKASNNASKNMLDSLNEWNKMTGLNKQHIKNDESI